MYVIWSTEYFSAGCQPDVPTPHWRCDKGRRMPAWSPAIKTGADGASIPQDAWRNATLCNSLIQCRCNIDGYRPKKPPTRLKERARCEQRGYLWFFIAPICQSATPAHDTYLGANGTTISTTEPRPKDLDRTSCSSAQLYFAD